MQLDPLVAWSLGELLLISLISVIVLLLRGVWRNRQDRSAAQALIGQIRSDEERRLQETTRILGEGYGIGGAGLDALVKRVSREEKRFYQTLINLYLMRDAGALRNLNVAFEEAVLPYRELPLPAAGESGGGDGDSVTTADADNAELRQLQEENERLSEELSITMDTMGRMLSEYSSMFSADGEPDKEKMMAMFQPDSAEAGAGSQPAASDPAEEPPVEEAAAAAADPPDAPSETTDGSGDEASSAASPDPEPASVAGSVDDEALMTLDDEPESMDEALPEAPAPKQVRL